MIDKSSIKLLIFDCDGVLFDSSQANIAYFEKCLDVLGLPAAPPSLLDKVPYMSMVQLFLELLNDESKAVRVFEESQNISYDPFLRQMKPLFDFEAVLVPLGEQYRMAVASNRSRSLQKVSKTFHLERYFQYMVSVLDAKAKPDPDMLYKCMDNFGVSNQQTVFIGDSVSDMQAANGAGVAYISIAGPGTAKTGDNYVKITGCSELQEIFL